MQSVAQIVVDGARWKEERDVYLSQIQSQNGIYVIVYKESTKEKTFDVFIQQLMRTCSMKNLQQIFLVRGETKYLKQLGDKVRLLQDVSQLTNYQLQQSETMNQMGLPMALDRMIKYFQNSNCYLIEGIFRKSGDVGQIDRVFERITKNDFQDLESQDPHVMASVFKRYLCRRPLLDSANIFKEKVDLKEVLESQDVNKLRILYVVIGFIKEFIKHEANNKMNAQNMAIIFAPCLIKSNKTCLVETGLSLQFMLKLLLQFEVIVPNFNYELFLSNQVLLSQIEYQDTDDWEYYCQQRRSGRKSRSQLNN